MQQVTVLVARVMSKTHAVDNKQPAAYAFAQAAWHEYDGTGRAAPKYYSIRDGDSLFVYDRDVSTRTCHVYVDDARRRVLLSFKPLSRNDLQDLGLLRAGLEGAESALRSVRYASDRDNVIHVVAAKYLPAIYRYYLSGHSLGGGIAMQLLLDPTFAKKFSGMTAPPTAHVFNAAYASHFNDPVIERDVTIHYNACDPVLRLANKDIGGIEEDVARAAARAGSPPLSALSVADGDTPPVPQHAAHYYLSRNVAWPSEVQLPAYLSGWVGRRGEDARGTRAYQMCGDADGWWAKDAAQVEYHSMSAFSCLQNGTCRIQTMKYI